MIANSASLRRVGLLRISAGTVILPRSWTVAARRRSEQHGVGRHHRQWLLLRQEADHLHQLTKVRAHRVGDVPLSQ